MTDDDQCCCALQLAFIAVLADHAAELVEWYLGHQSTDEFNRLLQVCRPCYTDEPRLLSAVASLVHVRTLLLGILYRKQQLTGLKELMVALQVRTRIVVRCVSRSSSVAQSATTPRCGCGVGGRERVVRCPCHLVIMSPNVLFGCMYSVLLIVVSQHSISNRCERRPHRRASGCH